MNTRLSVRLDDLEDAIARYGSWAGALKHTTRTGQVLEIESRIVLLPRVDERWIVAEFNRVALSG